MSADYEEFLRAYDTHRVTDQIGYYTRRTDEYRRTASRISWTSTSLLALASAAGTIGVWAEEPLIFGLIAAGLSALAAAVTSWGDVVGFSANAEMFAVARGGLAHVRPKRPDPVAATDETVGRYVNDVEDVLTREVSTWSDTWSSDEDARHTAAEASVVAQHGDAPVTGTASGPPADPNSPT